MGVWGQPFQTSMGKTTRAFRVVGILTIVIAMVRVMVLFSEAYSMVKAERMSDHSLLDLCRRGRSATPHGGRRRPLLRHSGNPLDLNAMSVPIVVSQDLTRESPSASRNFAHVLPFQLRRVCPFTPGANCNLKRVF